MRRRHHWVVKETKTIREIILERITDIGEATLDAFFPAKYPEARLWRNLLQSPSRRFSRRSFSAILSRLRREGLVERSGSRKHSRWHTSQKGAEYLHKLKVPPSTPDGIQRIVVFDIPEKMKGKRDMIRIELMANGYHQLQKSVWLGMIPLSKDFLELLDALLLKPYVHIFSVREKGTL